MKQNRGRLYIFIVILVCMCLPHHVFAGDYKIITADIKANVLENKVVEMEEKITAYFTAKESTFKRSLPLKIKVFEQGKVDEQKVVINYEKALNRDFNISTKNGFRNININDNYEPYKTYNFDLSYSIRLNKNLQNGSDVLYFYLIDGSPSTVYNVNFNINLPKDFDKEKISFVMNDGNKDEDTSSFINYNVDDNRIMGSINQTFEKGNTLAIRIELPNNYFIVKNFNINYMLYSLILPLVTLIISVIFWFKYKKGNLVKYENNSKPPYNFDSAEISYINKGSTQYKDIVSLIILLANKGFINIHYQNNEIKLELIKEYNENNAAQKILIQSIFKYNNIVLVDGIDPLLSDKIKAAINMLDNKENKNRIFFKKFKLVKIILLLLTILSLVSISFSMITDIVCILLMFVFGLGVFLFISKYHIVMKVIGVILIIINIFNAYLVSNSIPVIIFYTIGVLLILFSYLVCYLLPIRTKYGNKLYGCVKGFESVLKNMSEQNLAILVNKDNNYFYDMIPYAYVFNIYNTWVPKSTNIKLSKPEWLITDKNLNNYQICELIIKIYDKVNNQLVPPNK